MRYLSIAEAAERCALSVNTLKGYVSKGLFPQPDARIGKTRGWKLTTVDEWARARLPQPD